MITLAELDAADPTRIATVADSYQRLARHLDGSLDGVRTSALAVGDGWSGDDQAGGTAAIDAVRGQYHRICGAHDGLGGVGNHLAVLAETVRGAQHQLRQALDSVSGFGVLSADGGTLSLDLAALKAGGTKPAEIPDYAAKLRTAADAITDALRKATEADETARVQIALLAPEQAGGTVRLDPSIPLPRPGWTVDQVDEWWTGLTPAQRQNLLLARPDLIGPLDGVPAQYRDLANRTMLAGLLTDTENALKADPDNEALRDRLDGLNDIADRLDRPSGGAGYDDRGYLLLIDPSDDGMAVVSVGNPDLAENTFTFVPGTGADLDGTAGDIGRVDRMVADANLRDPGSTAGIMWLGYDAPDNLVDAAFPKYADGATDALQRFQDGIETTHHGDGLNTMVGHSYGTTVIGHTAIADGGVDTDQIVLVASPGVGTEHATDLGIGAENVYATTAPNDLIHVVPDASWAHGTAPVMEDFGAQVFDSPRYDGSPIEAHSGYWDDGNPTRDNIASIVTGNADEVPHGEYHKRWYQWRPWD